MVINPSCRDSSPTLQFPDRTYDTSSYSWNTRTSHHRFLQDRISCYYRISRPLTGLRFATKEIFHVTKLKTLRRSRAYHQVYAAQNYTIQTLEKPLAGGVQLIGKTKTTAFAPDAPGNGTEIDYLDPWNSNGVRYQTTGGSSGGVAPSLPLMSGSTS